MLKCSCTKKKNPGCQFWTSTRTIVHSCSSYSAVAYYLYHCCHRETFFQTRFWWGFSFHGITWTEAFHGLIQSTSFMTRYECSIMDCSQFENLALLIYSQTLGCNFISLLPPLAFSAHRYQFHLFLMMGFVFKLLFYKGRERQQVLNKMLPTPTRLRYSVWMSFSSHLWENLKFLHPIAWLS